MTIFWSTLFKKISPFLSAIIILVIFLVFLYHSSFWPLFLVFLAFSVFFTFGYAAGWKFISLNFFSWFVSAGLFVLGNLFFIAFLENKPVSVVVSCVVVALYLIFTRNVYTFVFFPDKYQPRALESISTYINIITVFFIFSLNFSLRMVLSLPLWWGGLVTFLTCGLCGFCVFWFGKADNIRSLKYSIFISLVGVESFWVFTFLPLGYLVSSFVLAVIFYLMTNFSLSYINATLNKTALVRNLVLGGLVILAVLASGRWT